MCLNLLASFLPCFMECRHCLAMRILSVLRTYLPSVLWHCWLGHLTRKNPSPMWPVMFGGTLILAQSNRSVCQTCHLWQTKESCARILIPHERPFTLVLRHLEWLVGAIPCTWNFGSDWPRWSEIAAFQLIFARSWATCYHSIWYDAFYTVYIVCQWTTYSTTVINVLSQTLWRYFCCQPGNLHLGRGNVI